MKVLEKVIDMVSISMMLVLFVVILLQIFFRYFLNMPIKWSEELARYIFVWVAMLGWTYGTRLKTHITVTFLYNKFPKKVKSIVFIFIQLLSISFSLSLGILSIFLMKQGMMFKAITLPINFAFIYSIVPIVSIILIIYAVLHLVEFFKEV